MDTMEDILADCNEVFRYDETRRRTAPTRTSRSTGSAGGTTTRPWSAPPRT